MTLMENDGSYRDNARRLRQALAVPAQRFFYGYDSCQFFCSLSIVLSLSASVTRSGNWLMNALSRLLSSTS